MPDSPSQPNRTIIQSGYAPINGLKMYYEIEGRGKPLVYIPPAFGYAGINSFPQLNKIRTVITPDLQGHGRTADIPNRPITFEQHAQDIVALLQHLGIQKADFLGESFGGIVATIISLRYPGIVHKIATYGATFSTPIESVKPDILHPNSPPHPESPGIQLQRENYKKVAPNPDYWPTIWHKVLTHQWPGFTPAELASIQAPTLIALGDHDFVRLDHALKIFQTIPHAQLAIIPDATHFVLSWGQEKIIPTLANFLNTSPQNLPHATADTGYHPGKTK